jgi:integration host factor subunit alpha
MTKQEIVGMVYEKLGFSKRESSDIVEHFFEIIKRSLAGGQNVKISGLGNFVVKEKRARKGRNPQTGEEIRIAPRRVLNFRLSQVLKDEINNNNNHNNGK